jgi:hypothetical protein
VARRGDGVDAVRPRLARHRIPERVAGAGARGKGPRPGERVRERKWGVGIRPTRQWDYLAIGCPTWTRTVRELFAHHPIVVETRHAGFHALTAPDTLAKLPSSARRGMLRVDGLHGLVTASSGGGWRALPLPEAAAASAPLNGCADGGSTTVGGFGRGERPRGE